MITDSWTHDTATTFYEHLGYWVQWMKVPLNYPDSCGGWKAVAKFKAKLKKIG